VLGNFPVNPVLPAQNGDRARAFYRDVLGLMLLSGPDDDPMMFRAGVGTTIVVTELPDRVPPPFPMISFTVTGIEELVEALAARGAQFQPLDPSASFAGTAGVARGAVMDFGPVKSAFLVDTEGNVLALNEIAGAAR
jgi:catechol 2,3-dioxygenase-like lactoylglutathione lyase family enzyme